MAEISATSLTTQLGRILVTGGSGFVGANLVTTLLDRGYQVRSFDRAPSPLPAQPGLEVLQGDICDRDFVAAAVDGMSHDQMVAARTRFLSFGTCSIDDPVADLVALGLLSKPVS